MGFKKYKIKLPMDYSIKDRDFIFLILVVMIWTHSILGDYLRAVLLRIPVVNMFPDLIITLFYCFVILLAIPYMWKKIRPMDVVTYVLIAFVCLFEVIFTNPNNNNSIYTIVPSFLLCCLPLYFVGLCWNSSRTIPLLYILSIISVYTLAFYIIFIGGGVGYVDSMNEDMYSAYKLLPHLIIICFYMLHKPNAYSIITSIFGTVLLFSFGTRGPIICLTAFVALYLLFFKSYKNNIKSKSIIVIAIISFVLLFEPMIRLIMFASSFFGMSTRVFSRLLDGTFLTHFSGRDIIQQLSIAAIKERPWLGYGVAGDRIVLQGSYAHNIILELMLSYGIPIGVIIFSFSLYKIIKGLKSNISEYNTAFILVLICCSFIKLFFSGTYLNEPLLFLLLGVCENSIRQKFYNTGE